LADLQPVVRSSKSISDDDFQLSLQWEKGGRVESEVERRGAIVSGRDGEKLLDEPLWQLADAIKEFSKNRARTSTDREFKYSKIRNLAIAANARLDNYTEKTVILDLSNLDLSMRVAAVDDRKTIEIVPSAEGLPTGPWLTNFDRHSSVQSKYRIVTDDGTLITVVPNDAVKEVLAEIKRMPARRISGNRAENFLRNPYALLGEKLASVIKPERFEAIRKSAGIYFLSFTIEPTRNERGDVASVVIRLIPEVDHAISLEPIQIKDKQDLASFCVELSRAISERAACFTWRRRTLEVRGDSAGQLELAQRLLDSAWLEPQPLLSAQTVLDLKRYSERITGIDVYKPVYSPYIKRPGQDQSWMPEDIKPQIVYIPPDAPDGIKIDLDKEKIEELKNSVSEAKANGQKTVVVDGLPEPMPVQDAEEILRAFAASEEDAANSEKVKGKEAAAKKPKKDSIELLIAENIENEEYVERRGQRLSFDESIAPEIPSTLKADVELKDHQKIGVSWMQNLWRLGEQEVRGGIVADDMGLGKTLQLLVFMAWYLETNPNGPPCLVVAPVALLENWQKEIKAFFTYNSIKLKVLHGIELRQVRADMSEIDVQLKDMGLTSFLRPDWLGDARLVLTTYEVLRDQEFSFALQRWGIMVCDEAQKIKSPSALVTRAAKKQNVRFRIACTGTPVENSLADLWCLFDFVQPGMLGALNEFSKRYRRPIEARTEEERDAIEKLRDTIQLQILRRLKSEVIDLPEKKEDEKCRSLPISGTQINLYSSAVRSYSMQVEAAKDKAATALLGMLHQIRMICADPHHKGFSTAANLPLREYCRQSPKMQWLLDCLAEIKKCDEKAIIFTEFRDVQRVLQRYIYEKYAIKTAIVNGDTSVGEGAGTRQALIDEFQARPGFNAIVLSTTAVGFGLNIQAANHVIHYTRPWNPAKEDQATDRAYRIGQTRPVTVYYPTIVAADFVTFEQKLDQLLTEKRQLATDMLNGAEDISLRDFGGMGAPNGEKLRSERVTPVLLQSIGPGAFERLCQIYWSRQGTQTATTPVSGDLGVDIVALRGNKGWLIQCKSAKNPNAALGWDGIKDVIAGQAHYQALHQNTDFGLVVMTNVRFNKTAHDQAELNNVSLVEYEQLSEFLINNTIFVTDIAS